ncbi:MAG TPA: RidA family protein [Steroidobacteraceae bacterium]|nr:RidA family protein [Steroidobacteraceae bacterium]
MLALVSSLSIAAAQAANVTRYPLGGNSKFPISRAVAVPAGMTIIFHSGTGPSPKDPSAQRGTAAYWGNTEEQTVSALNNIKKSLDSMGLSMGDVVKMNAFLVADPSTGHMDFQGFMKGYTQFFGTPEQPNLPARTALQVASLAGPGELVEIEVELATKSPPRHVAR